VPESTQVFGEGLFDFLVYIIYLMRSWFPVEERALFLVRVLLRKLVFCNRDRQLLTRIHDC